MRIAFTLLTALLAAGAVWLATWGFQKILDFRMLANSADLISGDTGQVHIRHGSNHPNNKNALYRLRAFTDICWSERNGIPKAIGPGAPYETYPTLWTFVSQTPLVKRW